MRHIWNAKIIPFLKNDKKPNWKTFDNKLNKHTTTIKMIYAQHSSNNGKNWQKLSYQKILLAW